MKNFKRLLASVTALLMLLSFASCGDSADKATGSDAIKENIPELISESSYIREDKTKIGVVNGAMGLGFAKFSIDRTYNYETTFGDEAQITELVTTGKVDVAAVPVELAAKLYKATNGGIKIVAVNSLGCMSVVEYGNTVKSIADLKGKTVYAACKDTADEAIINFVLEKNGIDPEKDIDIQFVGSNDEIFTALSEGKAAIGFINEPDVSETVITNPNFRVALRITDEWNKVSETKLAQYVVIVQKSFAEAKADILTECLSFNKISLNFLNVNPYAGPLLLVDTNLTESSDVAEMIIINSHLSFIEGDEVKTAVKAVFEMLYQQNPELIGGAIPDDNIF